MLLSGQLRCNIVEDATSLRTPTPTLEAWLESEASEAVENAPRFSHKLVQGIRTHTSRYARALSGTILGRTILTELGVRCTLRNECVHSLAKEENWWNSGFFLRHRHKGRVFWQVWTAHCDLAGNQQSRNLECGITGSHITDALFNSKLKSLFPVVATEQGASRRSLTRGQLFLLSNLKYWHLCCTYIGIWWLTRHRHCMPPYKQL